MSLFIGYGVFIPAKEFECLLIDNPPRGSRSYRLFARNGCGSVSLHCAYVPHDQKESAPSFHKLPETVVFVGVFANDGLAYQTVPIGPNAPRCETLKASFEHAIGILWGAVDVNEVNEVSEASRVNDANPGVPIHVERFFKHVTPANSSFEIIQAHCACHPS